MKEELKKAIKLIENNGGVVLMQELIVDQGLSDLIEKEAKEEAELEKFQETRREQLKNVRNDFDDLLKDKNFSVTAVEDMVHAHGCDMDDLENLIHGYY